MTPNAICEVENNTFVETINKFLDYLREAKHSSSNTLSAYVTDLRKFVDFTTENEIEHFDEVNSVTIKAYKMHLKSEGFSASTVSRALSALRSYFAYLISVDVISTNPAKEIHNDKNDSHLPVVMTSQEVQKLLEQPSGDDAKSVRDKAILELMYATGIKVTELISLNIDDVNLNFSVVYCRKGDKVREMPLYPLAVSALKRYLNDARKIMVINSSEKALFVNVFGERMTRQGLWKIIRAYAKQSGISIAITPHTLRNSFAAHLLENGADIHDIQEILGHADLSSTQRYATFLKERHSRDYIKFHPRA